ncbi:hypothetical protein J32TS6_08800 [Virgibacillus pantothenticus]|uniref:hypothetical protein n=1 Tax=Virgibacillus pantothenticus TaxID=1473 RepID=UPI001B2118F2|nr:hypothetical protein [Virgibacillus pantothenticus]GIP62325.1 hypothetical protein J32TS6_08800 [Virgibacillus pantothenticus]
MYGKELIKLKLLDELQEEDFAVLRGPFESGRQSPKNLAIALVLSTFIQPLMFFLTYVVAADTTIYPYKDFIMDIHFWITILLVVFSIFFAIPKVYLKNQKIQYLLIILVSQNVGAFFMYLISLFLLGSERLSLEVTEDSLISFTLTTLLLGLLVFIITCVRFYFLLKKGHYNAGTKKDKLRSKLEGKSYLPTAIIVGNRVGVYHSIYISN